MSIEIKVPTLPESVTDATISKWYVNEGDRVERDQKIVDLETEKVVLEVQAPQSGVISKILIKEGATVKEGELLTSIQEGGAGAVAAEKAPSKEPKKEERKEERRVEKEKSEVSIEELSPSVRRLVAEADIDVSNIEGTGKDGRITKEDVEKYIANQKSSKTQEKKPEPLSSAVEAREEKRVPMSRLRQKIAERLVQAQHQAAMLTTFNEVNMQAVMDLRNKYKDVFENRYGVRLGFMSFFTKAAVEALKRSPVVNASIDGTDLIYHNYYDIGIAVSTPRGLVVPVLRNADLISMADTEKQIKDFGTRARDGKLSLEEMTGGTFTITNGGVFGSMLSTPILNPPQTAILGMHNIVDRAVVENGQIVIRPMMYVALSYDHRVIDGRESVTFLKTIKELIEDPTRLMLEI